MFSYPKRVRNKLIWLYKRWRKSFDQIQTGQPKNAHPLFVFGVQRSGTNMLLRALDRSLYTWVYNEDNNEAFDNYRIRPQAHRQKLINRSRAKWVIFKPNCDLQHADRLLNQHPDSKAIWIYRRYQDVANSAIERWGRGQYEHIQRLVTQPDSTHWFCQDVPDNIRQEISSLYHEKLSDAEAGALKWYVRNSFLFELDLLSRKQQILLVNYEDLVAKPDLIFPQITDFISIPNDEDLYSFIFDSSVRKSDFPEISSEIQELCDQMYQRLNDAALAQTGSGDSS